MHIQNFFQQKEIRKQGISPVVVAQYLVEIHSHVIITSGYRLYSTWQYLTDFRSDYNHVIEENPECLAAQLNLALLLQCEGKHMLAWENLTKLLEHHKGQ